jgi:hypothetical protein
MGATPSRCSSPSLSMCRAAPRTSRQPQLSSRPVGWGDRSTSAFPVASLASGTDGSAQVDAALPDYAHGVLRGPGRRRIPSSPRRPAARDRVGDARVVAGPSFAT